MVNINNILSFIWKKKFIDLKNFRKKNFFDNKKKKILKKKNSFFR